jgi:hypothetical protein
VLKVLVHLLSKIMPPSPSAVNASGPLACGGHNTKPSRVPLEERTQKEYIAFVSQRVHNSQMLGQNGNPGWHLSEVDIAASAADIDLITEAFQYNLPSS